MFFCNPYMYIPHNNNYTTPSNYPFTSSQIRIGILGHFYEVCFSRNSNHKIIQLVWIDPNTGMVYLNEISNQTYIPRRIHFKDLYNMHYLGPFLYPNRNEIFKETEIIPKLKEVTSIYDNVLKMQIPLYTIPGKKAVFFISKMHIDADGAYKGYHQNDKLALDKLENGLSSLVIKREKRVIQGSKDPAPGYYISKTSLQDDKLPETNPRKYVDSTSIPYFVLPITAYKVRETENLGIKIGDIGVVINRTNGKMAFALFADVWPLKKPSKIGEGSIALACALGINPSPKTGGTNKPDILYIIFPGSGAGQGKLRTIQEIDEIGKKEFEQWGGLKQLETVVSMPPNITKGVCAQEIIDALIPGR